MKWGRDGNQYACITSVGNFESIPTVTYGEIVEYISEFFTQGARSWSIYSPIPIHNWLRDPLQYFHLALPCG